MAFIPVPFTMEAELIYATPGGVAENTLYFFNTEGWDVDSLEGAGDVLRDWWDAKIKPLTSTQVSLSMMRLTDLNSSTGAQITVVTGLPEAGTIASPVLPSNVTCAIAFRTHTRGRSYRGRNYFIGLTEMYVSGDAVQEPFLGSLQAAYNDLLTYCEEASFDWVVVSRYSGKNVVTGKPIPRASGVTTNVVAATVDATIDSQRRRLAGRGS